MMHLTNKIWLLTGPVHSGKTSALLNFVKEHPGAKGFLCPDIDGKRHLLDLNNFQMHPFEIDAPGSEQDIIVGKYIFSRATFQIAHSILKTSAEAKFNYFIIDEIGKLELDNNGLEPALSIALSHFTNARIILVVRDYLLEDVKSKYSLENAACISINDLNQIVLT